MVRKTGKQDGHSTGYERLKADLKNGELQQFYIFCGEEPYLRTYYLQQLESRLLSGPAGSFNEHRFTDENLTPEAFAEAVEAMPMMADRTYIRVDDVNWLKLTKDVSERYAAILEDLPEYCCVVFVYNAFDFKLSAEPEKLSHAIRKNACVVDFQKQSERELVTWVIRNFKAEGKEISDRLCQELIAMTDGTMTMLKTEIKKISGYCTTTSVSRSDLEAVVTPTLSAQSMDISKAVADGDYERAVKKLQELFAMQEKPIPILGAICWQLRQMQYAKIVMSAGKGQDALMELTGSKSIYGTGKTMAAARKVSEAFLKRAMELCVETDYQMKTSFDDPQRLLELLLARLVQEVRRG